MRLNTISLENFGPFRSCTVEFAPGLNALVGKNGAGKTSLLEGAHGCLTGDFRFPGTAADNRHRLAGKNDKCRVSLNFEHAGKTADMYRTLAPSSSRRLSLPDKSLTADKAIAAYLTEWLAIPLHVLSESIFVRQGCLADFLDLTDTRRAQACSELFGLEKLDRVYRTLNDRLLVAPIAAAPTVVLRARVAELEAESTSMRSALSGGPPADEAPLREALENLRRRKNLEAEVAQAYSAANAAIRAQEQSSASADELRRSAVAAAGRESEAKVLEDKSRQILAAHAAAAQVQAVRAGLANKLASIAHELSGLQVRRPDPPFDDRAALQNAEAECMAKQSEADSFLSKFDPSRNLTKCPTCNQAAPHLERLRLQYLEDRQTLHKLRQLLSVRSAELSKYEFSSARAERLQSDRLAAQSDLDGLVSLAGLSPGEVEFHQKRVADFAFLSQAARSAERAASTAEAQRDSLVSARSERWKRCESLAEVLGKMPEAGDADESVLERSIAKAVEMRSAYSAVLGRSSAIDGVLQTTRDSLAEAEKLSEAAAKDVSVRSRLSTLRDVFHPNGLPRRWSEIGLKRLAVGINRSLEVDFTAPFRVHVGDKLSLEVAYGDGRTHLVTRLSGGQMAVLALSFRLAVLQHFASGIGLLVMDEPTAGLDRENRRLFGQAVERLRSVSQSTGLQVIVVTHDEEVAQLFDRVVHV